MRWFACVHSQIVTVIFHGTVFDTGPKKWPRNGNVVIEKQSVCILQKRTQLGISFKEITKTLANPTVTEVLHCFRKSKQRLKLLMAEPAAVGSFEIDFEAVKTAVAKDAQNTIEELLHLYGIHSSVVIYILEVIVQVVNLTATERI